jgi:hypothetical protein
MKNRLTNWILQAHRVMGWVLCVFFLMWFLSGIVMLYHRFPRVYDSDRVEHLEALGASPDSLPSIETLQEAAEGKSARSLRMERYLGQTYFKWQASNSTYTLLAENNQRFHDVTEPDYIKKVVATWNQSSILRIDTIYKLDQWTPFGSMKEELPFYRYHFDDAAHHQLYQGSVTGRVLQYTTQAERIWAWLGAIPHWIYFYQLRQYVETWSDVVIYLSGAGCIMVILGLWVGIVRWRQHRKHGNSGVTPYKKKWYRWHHIAGLAFGVFALTFVFSGMMSMMPLPSWITHSHLQSIPSRYMQAAAPQPIDYVLDYRKVVEAYPEAQLLQWSHLREHPYYVVTTPNDVFYIDAQGSEVMPLNISRDEFLGYVNDFFKADSTTMNKQIDLQVEELDHFETYYRARSMIDTDKLLPVWKITADDVDNSVFYMNPRDASVRHVDRSSRLNYWAYTALHRMRIGFLNSNPTLRKTLIWILMLGGAGLSFTGIVLGINRFRRMIKRK